MKKARLTEEEKQRLIRRARGMLRQNATYQQVSTDLGISKPLLQKWLREETLNRLLPQVPNPGHLT